MGAKRVIAAESIQSGQPESFSADSAKRRFSAQGKDPKILADVYREEVNIAIWQRDVPQLLHAAICELSGCISPLKLAMTVSPQSALSSVSESLGTSRQSPLSESIAELVEMFCYLFGLERAGLRLSELDTAMCPRFHVDRVPCRLVTTYMGAGTEWLPHSSVDRSRLGSGNNGQSDLQSGLLRSACDIEQLCCGEVALLKGEQWEGNVGAGLVHRSPAVSAGRNRLLLTLDFSR